MELIREINDNKQIKSYKDVINYLDEFRNQDREMFIVLGLDTNARPIYREITAVGTLNATMIHPREIFKKAIVMSCNSIILAHNHPSGNVEPSAEDKKITKLLLKCSKILNIEILDHVILGENDCYSFQEKGEMK